MERVRAAGRVVRARVQEHRELSLPVHAARHAEGDHRRGGRRRRLRHGSDPRFVAILARVGDHPARGVRPLGQCECGESRPPDGSELQDVRGVDRAPRVEERLGHGHPDHLSGRPVSIRRSRGPGRLHLPVFDHGLRLDHQQQRHDRTQRPSRGLRAGGRGAPVACRCERKEGRVGGAEPLPGRRLDPGAPVGLGSDAERDGSDRNAHRFPGTAGGILDDSHLYPGGRPGRRDSLDRRRQRVDPSPGAGRRRRVPRIQSPAGQRQRRPGPLEPDLAEWTGRRQRYLPVHRRVVRGFAARQVRDHSLAHVLARGSTMGLTEVVKKAAFEATHVYSSAAEAGKKRAIDKQIMGGDYSQLSVVDMRSEAYLKELIRIASGGGRAVVPDSRGLQFYMIKGGGEGFLDTSYRGQDASRVIESSGTTTSGAAGTVMIFDNNDLLAVFHKSGALLGSALLSRPISIKHPNIWSEPTANRIYDAWDRRSVTLYHNRSFDVTYYGLMIHDKLGWYASGKVRVDLHKEEATNGCIFIIDPNTPPYSDLARLNAFEPKLIRDIQKTIGAKAKHNIGTMHVITIA